MKFRQLKELIPEPTTEEETVEEPEPAIPEETSALPSEPPTEFPSVDSGDSQILGDEQSKPDDAEGICFKGCNRLTKKITSLKGKRRRRARQSSEREN